MDNFDCSQTEHYMNDFIEGSIVGEDMWFFLNHVLQCPSCYEELETRYLLSEALMLVESGQTIDLAQEIADKINNSRTVLRMHRRIKSISRSLQIVSMVVIAYAIVNIILNYL